MYDYERRIKMFHLDYYNFNILSIIIMVFKKL